uniref:protein disulfide-isomerase n=1 Tax=Gorilla gorilla gorilla TaxID=9595 RepID=G3QYJ3_GORGO
GMVDTAKKNFGGGNTAWEEKTLSKYESSEIRLLEILEGLCESSDFECNQMLEAQEEHLEAWWLQLKSEYPDLFEWFCVKTLKVCCSPGTYGPDCLACQGGSQRPCSGNGHCSGDGSRQGDGSCRCHRGYQGPLCTDCMDGYFSSLRNETHSICTVRTGLSDSYPPCCLSLGCWRGVGHAWIRGRNTHTQPGYSSRVWIAAFSPACDESCKTCSGLTNRDCGECEVGWVLDEGACDVDECAAEPPPCSAAQFCKNANGSYTCEECDSSCVGCTGEGPGNCKECIPGYARERGQCADVDECSLAEKACAKKDENCYNTPGSYVCVCPDGFEETEDACVPPAEAEATEGENPTQLPSREDL